MYLKIKSFVQEVFKYKYSSFWKAQIQDKYLKGLFKYFQKLIQMCLIPYLYNMVQAYNFPVQL